MSDIVLNALNSIFFNEIIMVSLQWLIINQAASSMYNIL